MSCGAWRRNGTARRRRRHTALSHQSSRTGIVNMSYVPNTAAEQQAMLQAVGVGTIEELLSPGPADVRLTRPLALPAALAEPDIKRVLGALAERNAPPHHIPSFLVACSYHPITP